MVAKLFKTQQINQQKNGEEILARLIDGEGFDEDFRETPPRPKDYFKYLHAEPTFKHAQRDGI